MHSPPMGVTQKSAVNRLFSLFFYADSYCTLIPLLHGPSYPYLPTIACKWAYAHTGVTRCAALFERFTFLVLCCENWSVLSAYSAACKCIALSLQLQQHSSARNGPGVTRAAGTGGGYIPRVGRVVMSLFFFFLDMHFFCAAAATVSQGNGYIKD